MANEVLSSGETIHSQEIASHHYEWCNATASHAQANAAEEEIPVGRVDACCSLEPFPWCFPFQKLPLHGEKLPPQNTKLGQWNEMEWTLFCWEVIRIGGTFAQKVAYLGEDNTLWSALGSVKTMRSSCGNWTRNSSGNTNSERWQRTNFIIRPKRRESKCSSRERIRKTQNYASLPYGAPRKSHLQKTLDGSLWMASRIQATIPGFWMHPHCLPIKHGSVQGLPSTKEKAAENWISNNSWP